MLQSRRVIDITNTICNYLFLVFLLLFGIYVSSFWHEYNTVFITYLVSITNTIGLTINLISTLLLVTALVLWIADHKLKVGLLITSLLRIGFCFIIMFSMSTLSNLVATGFEVRL